MTTKANPIQHMLSECRDAGFDARMRDETLGHNPYARHSLAFNRWVDGWKQADRELEKIAELREAGPEYEDVHDISGEIWL